MNSPSVLEPAALQGSVLILGVGASQGLGAAIALRFAAGGFPVAIAGRNAEKLGATAAEISATGAKVSHVVGDASKATDVANFVEAAQCQSARKTDPSSASKIDLLSGERCSSEPDGDRWYLETPHFSVSPDP